MFLINWTGSNITVSPFFYDGSILVICHGLIHFNYLNNIWNEIRDNITRHILFELWVGMQTSVAALLIVTSSVLLACVVIDYAVVIFEQNLDTETAPQIDRIQYLENIVLNQTDTLINQIETLNQTDTQPTGQLYP